MKSSSILFALALPTAVESFMFGFLHWHGEELDSEAEAEEFDFGDPDVAGDSGTGFFLTPEQQKVGRRGLACLQYAAGVENDPFGDLGILANQMTRVLMEYYGQDGLDMMCQQTYGGRKLLAEANGEEFFEEETFGDSSDSNYSTPTQNEERRTATCAQTSAIYPNNAEADPEGVYTEYATSKYQEFVEYGDISKRSSIEAVIERVNNEIAQLFDVGSGLRTCTNIWSAVNSAVGVIDVPAVDPQMISESILSFSCVLANDYNDIVIRRKQRTLELLQYHDQVVTSAEISAAYQNTITMMSDVCEVAGNMETMQLEMEIIEAYSL